MLRSYRLEHRHEDLAGLLEFDPDRHADLDPLVGASDDVGDQPQTGLLDELDQRDVVRNVDTGTPLLVVDGERHDMPAATDSRDLNVVRQALPADRGRWMQVEAAVRASQNPQLSLGATGPEMPVHLGDQRQNAVRGRLA